MEYYSPSEGDSSLSDSDVEGGTPKKQLRLSSDHTSSYRKYAEHLEDYISETWQGDKETSLLSRPEWKPLQEEWPTLV